MRVIPINYSNTKPLTPFLLWVILITIKTNRLGWPLLLLSVGQRSVDPSNDKINIYPNPAFEWLVAEWGQTDTPERLTLYNAAGQPCRVITQEGKALLNTASLPKGLYWLEIIQKGERTVQAIGVQ